MECGLMLAGGMLLGCIDDSALLDFGISSITPAYGISACRWHSYCLKNLEKPIAPETID